MKTRVPFLSILALSVATALGVVACDKTLHLSDFDTSCQKDSDCIAVYVGPPACCEASSPNAAINVSDQAKYDSEVHAQGLTCNVECGAFGPIPVPVCSAGTCALTFVDGGAPVDGGP